MIISHAHRFIFVKTRKTAGTSIEIALRPLLGPRDVATPVHSDDEAYCAANEVSGPQNYRRSFRDYRLYDWRRFVLDGKRQDYRNHLPGPRIRQMVGRDVWDSYYKFCVERDPFDKIVSGYYWSMSERERKSQPVMTLDEFVYSEHAHDYSDWDRYADNPYRPIVDRILRFDHLQPELDEVCARLGLPVLELPRLKGTQRKDKRPAVEVLGIEAMLHLEEHVFARECHA
jgi:hypothetical protein